MLISLNRNVVVDMLSLFNRYANKNIIISIDSSKTNTALCVMNSNYKILDVIEFDGSNDDILSLIKEQRYVIKNIFEGSNILEVGIEDIITKKDEKEGGKYSTGLQHHHSRYVITAVFVSIICIFQDAFNITPEPISNQVWKATVLPKELNRRNIYKGSVDYVKTKYPKYIINKKDDDVCDAICIGEYMKIRSGIDKDSSIEDIPNEEEFIVNPYKVRIFREESTISKEKGVQFEFNNNLNLEFNARAVANRLETGQLGWFVVDINKLDISDIYNYCTGKFSDKTNKVKVVIKRI